MWAPFIKAYYLWTNYSIIEWEIRLLVSPRLKSTLCFWYSVSIPVLPSMLKHKTIVIQKLCKTWFVISDGALVSSRWNVRATVLWESDLPQWGKCAGDTKAGLCLKFYLLYSNNPTPNEIDLWYVCYVGNVQFICNFIVILSKAWRAWHNCLDERCLLR